MSMPTLSWEVFYKCIEEIKTLSDKLGDGWKMFNEDKEHEAYLKKRSLIDIPKTPLLTFEYHIAYNVNYSVPILCFNAFRLSGAILQIDEIWTISKLDQCDKITAITQMDHPVLRQPFFTIHPCRTEEALEAVQNSKNIVATWMSMYGPIVNLKVKEEYSKLT